MLNVAQANAAMDALVYPGRWLTREVSTPMLAAYRKGERKIQEEFLDYLEETYATSENPEVLAMLRKASWSDGHASGFQNVEHYYSEYAELSDEEILELDF